MTQLCTRSSTFTNLTQFINDNSFNPSISSYSHSSNSYILSSPSINNDIYLTLSKNILKTLPPTLPINNNKINLLLDNSLLMSHPIDVNSNFSLTFQPSHVFDNPYPGIYFKRHIKATQTRQIQR